MLHAKKPVYVLQLIVTFAFVAAFLLVGNSGDSVSALENQQGSAAAESASPDSFSCSIIVNIKGAGQVTVSSAGDQILTLDQSENPLELPCSELVTLTVEPSARWRFDHWQGVPEDNKYKSTITLLGSAEPTAVFVPRAVTFEPVVMPFYDRGGELVTELELLESIWRPIPENSPAAANAAAPVIEIWYGAEQNFGLLGTAQEYINILGNTSDIDGDLNSMTYTLNGGSSHKLSIGGDKSWEGNAHRLAMPGDFNVEIKIDALRPLPETNTIVISAKDSLGLTAQSTVTVNYNADTNWPIPYRIDWSSAASLPDVVQVVDGKWEISENGLRTVDTGYDRFVAIGEGTLNGDVAGTNWTDFVVTVPVTINAISEDGFDQVAPALGIIARWQGHTDDPDFSCVQLKCGYIPVGAASWYQWDRQDRDSGELSIWPRLPSNKYGNIEYQFEIGKTYMWKVTAEEENYSLKVWPAGQQEPQNPLITAPGKTNGLHSGSILLLSHHVDVTFGDVSVCPLDGCPPLISDVSAEAGLNQETGVSQATVSWQTDVGTTSRLEYWLDPTEKMLFSDDTFRMEHNVLLENLQEDMIYSYQIVATDEAGKQSKSEIETFTTEPVVVETFTLEATSIGPGTVTVEPEQKVYESGNVVTLTAVPDSEESYFAGWNFDANGNENPLKLEITADTKIEAAFEYHQVVNHFEYYLPMTKGE